MSVRAVVKMFPTSFDGMPPLLESGARLHGKWSGRTYSIVKQLGSGANGVVYAGRLGDQIQAIKLSCQAADIALEYKALSEWQKTGSATFAGPRVYELDDAVIHNTPCFFYAMEYVRGETMDRFVSRRGVKWVGPLILQLLTSLYAVHQTRHAFGDLKTENVLVQTRDAKVRLIDFGGMTPFGRGVRQFTKWYDRAWWGQGERKADPTYDLFALTQMICALCLPEFEKKWIDSNRPGPELWGEWVRVIERDERVRLWKPIVQSVWNGHIVNTLAMRDAVRRAVVKGIVDLPKVSATTGTGRKPHENKRLTSVQTNHKSKPDADWTTWFLVLSAAAACFAGTFVWHIWS